MITAKGLELRLREMRVWTKFQKNFFKSYKDSKNVSNLQDYTDIPGSDSYSQELRGAFIFGPTPEGQSFWYDIADKIDKVKL